MSRISPNLVVGKNKPKIRKIVPAIAFKSTSPNSHEQERGSSRDFNPMKYTTPFPQRVIGRQGLCPVARGGDVAVLFLIDFFNGVEGRAVPVGCREADSVVQYGTSPIVFEGHENFIFHILEICHCGLQLKSL